MAGPLPTLTATSAGVRLDLNVIPRARKTVVDGVRAGRLVVRVTAPPVDGAANEAVIDAVAGALDLRRRAIRLVAGATSRRKVIEISGLDATELAARLGRLSS